MTPGSFLGALLWVAISGLFALYTSFSHSYDRTYGFMDRIFNGPLQYRHHRRQAAALADRPAG